MLNRLTLVLTLVCIVAPTACCETVERPTRPEVVNALHRAVRFFREEVSAHGGYLWRYSADLSLREGEGKATALTAWVQPPGTPTVGSAYLNAYELTGDTFYLEAARETADALVRGQLQSGGWDYRIEFEPGNRKRYAYRVKPGNKDGMNVTTLDDNTTQSALRFLMRVDQTMDFKDETVHEAVMYALESLLKVQYPIGAWPQRYSEFPDSALYPVKKAGFPKTWSRTYQKTNYRRYYTFNDNAIADMIATMFDAADIYDDDKYTVAAEKAGDFILLAQMPDPQPAWAQQYDADMHPAWARKFEPPAVTGGESQGVMRTLIQLYRKTGKDKYLEPLPRAIAYLKRSRLPDGRLARFYELETNKPLFFTKEYELTYSSDDMPTHYAFIVSSALDAIELEYQSVRDVEPDKLDVPRKKKTYRMTRGLADRARRVIDRMDERGAWVEQGALENYSSDSTTSRIIDTRTFVGNVSVLSEFIAASR